MLMSKRLNIDLVKLLIMLTLFNFVASAFSVEIDIQKLFKSKLKPQSLIPSNYKVFNVQTPKDVYIALSQIHNRGDFAVILFDDGLYRLNHTLNISADNVMLMSKSHNPYNVIIRGNGMKQAKYVDNLIRVTSDNFVLEGLTLE